jgi:hypothetical protein
VYLSGHNQCKRCAVETAKKQAEFAFELGRKLARDADKSYDGGVKRGVAYLQAMHADAVKRRKKKKPA